MIIKFKSTTANFDGKNLYKIDIDNIIPPGDDEPVTPDEPQIPIEPNPPMIPDTIPESYNLLFENFRDDLSEEEKKAVFAYLYLLNNEGLMSKTTRLYMPCLAPSFNGTMLNVADYFNKSETITNTTCDLWRANASSPSMLAVCKYGMYRTGDIKWGDTLTVDLNDNLPFNDFHVFYFKPAQQDASTATHSGGLTFRPRTVVAENAKTLFTIGGSASATGRTRGSLATCTVSVNGVSKNIKTDLFIPPTGYGNGTHDPYIVGVSFKDSKMLLPGSNYNEFAYNNRNLVNEISECPLIEGAELPTSVIDGKYALGGYCGTNFATQENLATSIMSIGRGLTKDEIQKYMDITDEFMTAMDIKNHNWNPDNLS